MRTQQYIEGTLELVNDDYQEATHIIINTANLLPKSDGDQLIYEWKQYLLSENICPECTSDLHSETKLGEKIEYQGVSFRPNESHRKCDYCGWNELNN